MSIVGLNGQEVKSQKSEEELRNEALAKFNEMMAEIDAERIPLGEEPNVQDVYTRIKALLTAINSTYRHVESVPKGNDAQGRYVEIKRTLEMPLFTNQQIVVLGERLYSLAAKL